MITAPFHLPNINVYVLFEPFLYIGDLVLFIVTIGKPFS